MKAQSEKPPHRARWPAGLAAMLAATLLLSGTAWGNNLVIENFELTGFNETGHYVMVQFDLRWEDSWRLGPETGAANYDAAWVFVKFRWADGVWHHATLNPTGHNVGTCNVPAVLDMPSDAVGTFVYRTSVGMSDFSCTDVQLRWNYGEDRMEDNEGNIDIAVLGVEMVYIPEGSFHLGSGGTERGHFYTYPNETSTYVVTSEAAMDVGATDGYLYYQEHPNPGYYGDNLGPVPAAFPKGYAPFYLMKYELTQQQYVDFLNTQGPGDAHRRNFGQMGLPDDAGDPPIYSAPVPDRPLGYMRYDVAQAYADWAGLRWPTEMEWEKAARGVRPPVPNEYAWGGTGLSGVSYEIANEGTPDEIITNPGTMAGNAAWSHGGSGSRNNIPGRRPGRAGIFAASFPNATHPGPPSRPEAGASFYGVMEMSGNLWEWVVTVGNGHGRDFEGAHGDGSMQEISWYVHSNSLRFAAGARGGCFDYSNIMQVSRRNLWHNSVPTGCSGLRAARTAP